MKPTVEYNQLTVALPIKYYELIYHPSIRTVIQISMNSATDCNNFQIIGKWRFKDFLPYRITKK